MCDQKFNVRGIRQSVVAMTVVPTVWLVAGFIALALYDHAGVAMGLAGCAAGSLLAGGCHTWWKLRDTR